MTQPRFFLSLLIVAIGLFWLLPASALAHGTDIRYTVEGNQIVVEAIFDDGTPMPEAQIVVYAPNDPQQPYMRGIADENGFYRFTIDNQISGSWDVSVRTAGHGEIINIPVAGDGSIGVQRQSLTWLRPVLTVAVIAALVAVALYFSKGKSTYARA